MKTRFPTKDDDFEIMRPFQTPSSFYIYILKLVDAIAMSITGLINFHSPWRYNSSIINMSVGKNALQPVLFVEPQHKDVRFWRIGTKWDTSGTL